VIRNINDFNYTYLIVRSSISRLKCGKKKTEIVIK